MNIAINTNAVRKSYTPEQIVATALDAGVTGLEWGLDTLENAAADAKQARRLADDAGLKIVSFINGGKLWKHDEMRRWSGAVAEAGGNMLRVAHPWFGYNYEETVHQPEKYTVLLERARIGLIDLMDMGKEFGVRYVLETHSGSCFASPMAALVLREFDPRFVGLIYDPANTCIEGFIRPRGAVELMGDFLAYCHIKNLLPVFNTAPGGDKLAVTYEKRPLAQGMVDYEEVMFALKLAGFQGWMSFEEPYRGAAEFAAEVREGVAHLEHCAEIAPDAVCEPFTHFND